MLPLARGKEGVFKLVSSYRPQGDQPSAIDSMVSNVQQAVAHQVLLGVTGSGKTFTMANVIERVNRPTLVIAPNKTLAAQLYNEFKSLFPDNAVRYFVSYYDYYQPEAYVPSTDTFIEKDASINDEIDKLRHSATKALLERNDVLIVASVSCIYGLGEPEVYFEMLVFVEEGQTIERDRVLRKLVDIHYQRNDYDFHRGTFRVRGDTIEVFPAYEESRAVRIEFFGDQIETLSEIDALRGKVIRKLQSVAIYPASHYVTTSDRMERFTDPLLAQYGVRLIIGKGGMREASLAAFKRYSGAYLAIIGGAAALETTWIEQIEDVDLDDLNPESLWKFSIRDFGPLLVAMDSHGASLYRTVADDAQTRRAKVLAELGVRSDPR